MTTTLSSIDTLSISSPSTCPLTEVTSKLPVVTSSLIELLNVTFNSVLDGIEKDIGLNSIFKPNLS